MAKKIILCADDFGQYPHISQAILILAEKGRISATSCITTEEDWTKAGLYLKELRPLLDIGLHFNLTEGDNPQYHSPFGWLGRALIRQIDPTFVSQQLNYQLDSFLDVMGGLPDFIDGHQHIHSFPHIRDILIDVIQKRFGDKKPYVRTLCPMLPGGPIALKPFILRGVSSRFTQALDSAGLPHNASFGGVYSLQPSASYRSYMVRWLHQAQLHTLLMCHPGQQSPHPTKDPIPGARVIEYTYLLSSTFQEDLEEAGVCLGKLA